MNRRNSYDLVTWILFGVGLVIGAGLYERRIMRRVIAFVNARLAHLQTES